MLTAAVLWLLSLYALYMAIRYGVQHGLEGARRTEKTQQEDA